MPYSSDLHVDAVLSQFAIQYRQDQNLFIADAVSPRVPVMKESDKYIIYTKKDRFTLPASKRADGTAANKITWGKDTEGTYVCEEYALRDVVTDRAKANADKPIDLQLDTQQFLQDLIMLDREKRAADLLFSGTTFSGYTAALAVADRWDNYESSSSDPFADIETMRTSVISNSMKFPNVLTLGYQVYEKLCNHPLVLDRVKGGATTNIPALLAEAELAKLFKVDRVLVGRAIVNANNVGQTASYGFVWGKYALMAYINPAPLQVKKVTCSLSPMAQDFRTKRWRDEEVNGEWVETGEIIDEIVPAAACGYLFSTVVS